MFCTTIVSVGLLCQTLSVCLQSKTLWASSQLVQRHFPFSLPFHPCFSPCGLNAQPSPLNTSCQGSYAGLRLLTWNTWVSGSLSWFLCLYVWGCLQYNIVSPTLITNFYSSIGPFPTLKTLFYYYIGLVHSHFLFLFPPCFCSLYHLCRPPCLHWKMP